MSLSTLLSQLNALSKYHSFWHWKTTGSNYFADHLLAQRLYEETHALIDGVAEKSVGLFGEESIDVVQDAQATSKLLASWKELRVEHDLPSVALKAVRDVIVSTSDLKHDLGDKLTDGLSNMLDDISDKLESHVYLLQQRTTKTASYGPWKTEERLIPEELITKHWMAGNQRHAARLYKLQYYDVEGEYLDTEQALDMLNLYYKGIRVKGPDVEYRADKGERWVDYYTKPPEDKIEQSIQKLNAIKNQVSKIAMMFDDPDFGVLRTEGVCQKCKGRGHILDKETYDPENECHECFGTGKSLKLDIDTSLYPRPSRYSLSLWRQYIISGNFEDALKAAQAYISENPQMDLTQGKAINMGTIFLVFKHYFPELYLKDKGIEPEKTIRWTDYTNQPEQVEHSLEKLNAIRQRINKQGENMNDILTRLIKLGYHLDLQGLTSEADQIDQMIATLIKRVGLSPESLASTADYLDQNGLIEAADLLDGMIVEAAKTKYKTWKGPGEKPPAGAAHKAPKGWWDKMEKDLKKKNPDYSAKRISEILGDIWDNQLTHAKRTRIFKQYGKKGEPNVKKKD